MSNKNSFNISKKLLGIIAIVVSVIYVNSIIATYFGKPDSTPDYTYCKELLCSNSILLTSNSLMILILIFDVTDLLFTVFWTF